MARYYARYARHGAGLVMTEAAYPDERASRAYFRQPGMANARHAQAWRPVVDAVHAAGAPIVLQLQHGGRLAEPGLHAQAVGASGRAPAGVSWQGGQPYAGAPLRALAAAEEDAIAASFGSAARLAMAAGFDGVEIHGARGYLLDEFLSQPGRALEARLRLPLAVARAVREAFPYGPVTYNFSLYKMDDLAYQPPGGAGEVAAIAASLCAQGVDALHVTTRRVLREEAFGAPLARVVRDAVPGRTLIVNGGIRTLQDAEAALAATGAELVALARALLANPDWPDKARSGAPMTEYVPGMERRALEG
jgi:2,4-dienoyl-CoA reductase-like NADH-dependent reductase (Old Yellow Enzyme family)